MTGYSEWCSWHNYAAVDPTQTVVDLYYPTFTDACARLTSRAPTELQLEFNTPMLMALSSKALKTVP